MMDLLKKKWRFANWAWFALWQGAQLALLALFLFLLFRGEGRFLAEVQGDTVDMNLVRVQFELQQLQWSFLPKGFWLLFWPLLCVTAGLALFTRARWYFLGAVGLVSQLLLIGDRIYHEFFSAIISMASFRAADQVWAVRSSVFAALRPADLGALALFAAFPIYGFLLNRRVSFRLKDKPAFFLTDKIQAALFLILACHAGLVAYAIPGSAPAPEQSAFGEGEIEFVRSYRSSNLNYALHFGLFNYHLKDFCENLGSSFSSRKPSATQVAQVREMIERSDGFNRMPSPYFGIARGRNVVLISMEAFQHLLIGLTVEGQEITPTLNRLAGEAFCWDYILDNVGVGGTSDAEFSILTGLLPDTRQISSLTIPARNRLVALPATLRAQGYATASLHGYTPSFWKRETNHPKLGIEHMYFQNSFSYQKLGMGVPDEAFFNQSVALLQGLPSPFFAFLISLSSHHPYSMTPPGEQHLKLAMERSMARDYLRAANYADRALRQFLEGMAAAGMAHNTMFVIYGDHVAPMTREGSRLLAEASGIDPASLRQKRVPLLIHLPGANEPDAAARAQIAATLGGLQDVFPTICHLLGMRTPAGPYGVHLFIANAVRPPMPSFKRDNGFVSDGLLYDPQTGRPVSDGHGILYFADNDPPDVSELRALYLQVGADVAAHRLIFDHDAQWYALRQMSAE